MPINRRNSCRWVIFIDQTTEPFKTNHRMSDYSPIDLLPRTKLMNMHVNSANRRCCYGILEFSSAACHAGQTAALRSVLTAADEGGGRPQWECSFSELYKFEATLDQNCVYKISYHFHFFKPHMKSLIILEPFLVVCNRGWLGRTSPPKKWWPLLCRVGLEKPQLNSISNVSSFSYQRGRHFASHPEPQHGF